MVEQKQKNYTITTPMGHEIKVRRLSKQDIKKELAELEAKYGITSAEFAKKWNAGELDCAVRDYFDWAWYCDCMSKETGFKDLEIVHTNVQEWKIE